MYFNSNQQRVVGGIVNSIELYGKPELIVDGDQLCFKVDKLSAVQTLFAIVQDETGNADILAGVMLYSRVSEKLIVLLHIGIHEDYSAEGPNADMLLAMRMICKLRELAGRIKGVTCVELLYPKKVITRMGVN